MCAYTLFIYELDLVSHRFASNTSTEIKLESMLEIKWHIIGRQPAVLPQDFIDKEAILFQAVFGV